MAAQAKGYRLVKKEELEACMEDARDAIDNAKEQKLKTNIVRTLTSRRNALNTSFEAWSKACGDYSLKSSATMTTVEKNTDTTDNVRPVMLKSSAIRQEVVQQR